MAHRLPDAKCTPSLFFLLSIHNTMRRLLLHVLLLFATADAYPASCSNATCGGQTITYPFWLAYSGPNCGYPGLGLVCEDSGTLTLGFQFHRYRVLSIDYAMHTTSLADVDAWNKTCPQLSFNLSVDPNSWLQLTSFNSNLTFLYNCNANVSRPSAVKLNGCPEHKNGYVLRDDGVTGNAYGYGCEEVVVAPVLGAERLVNPSLVEMLSGGFEMRYDARSEQCGTCEQSGGRCSYGRIEEHGGTDFTCFCDDGANKRQCGDARLLRLKRRKLYIIASTLSFLLLCLLFFSCLLGYKKYGSKMMSKVTTRIKPFIQNWTKRISKRTQRIESFLQKHGTRHPKRYNYAEVKRMTKSFSVKLGQGGFGAVYRGNLSDGRQVAVKMLKDSKGDGEEFINEVTSISETSHVNVVTLLGFCLQRSKRALIYEYMPNGSLERYAFNNSKDGISITWEKLFDIAVGIARGLEYLHCRCNTRIVHFDIKPHNILLDQEFCPKISDFGMAKLCVNKESIISIGGARGTIGYIAPEVYSKQFGTVSSKSDVYSYGMMILEMVGAREKNINANSESSSQYFPQWIYEHLDDYCVSASEINGEITEIVRKLIVVGLWCIQVSPTNRPTMTRVVQMLEGGTSGLELPPKVLLSFLENEVLLS